MVRDWLALSRIPGVGPATFRDLLDRFGDPTTALAAGPPDAVLGSDLRQRLSQPDWAAADADLAWSEGPDRHILTLHDPRYPALLREVAAPPPVLFVAGNPIALGEPQLAMVGSRNPTSGGRDTAFELARHLAGTGLNITSGLALGIDGAAHRGALEAAGQTIAVTGTGPDRVYPARHKVLAHAIIDGGGALVTEFPPGTGPMAENFPRRNRIISGLSLGTLVVEAALRSGSLITARRALEQGREVFAIPGSIHNPLARGCHRLIREGAKLVETAADILEELAPQLRQVLNESAGPASECAEERLDPEQRKVLDCLGFEPATVDRLVERSGLTAESVSSILLLLELEGYVVAAAGGLYSRYPRTHDT